MNISAFLSKQNLNYCAHKKKSKSTQRWLDFEVCNYFPFLFHHPLAETICWNDYYLPFIQQLNHTSLFPLYLYFLEDGKKSASQASRLRTCGRFGGGSGIIVVNGHNTSWTKMFPVCITIDPITVLEVDNEKDTLNHNWQFLPENVDSTPKWHLGILDLTLRSSSHLWKTTDYLRITVQLPLQLGVVIWLVFRSEWEQWSLPYQHGIFKMWEIVWNDRDNFQVFLQSLEKVSLTYWCVKEYKQFLNITGNFLTARTYTAPTTTAQQEIIKRNLPTLPTKWRTTGVLIIYL